MACTICFRDIFHSSNYQARRVPKLGEQVSFELADPSTIGGRKQVVNITPITDDTGAA